MGLLLTGEEFQRADLRNPDGRDHRGVDRPHETGVERFAVTVDDEVGGVAQICQKLDVGAVRRFRGCRTVEGPRYGADS